MVFQLQTFGEPRLIDENGRVVAFPEKALFACAHLLTRSTARMSRQELADFLWPESDSIDPRVNLRQLLVRIRARQNDFETPLFVFTSGEVAVDPNSVECDFTSFLRCNANDPFPTLAKFLSVVTGEFLFGCEFRSEKGAIWLDAARTRLLHHASNCLEKGLERSLSEENRHLIKEAAYRLLEFDSCNEAAYRALMVVLAGEGRISQVKTHFYRYKDQLWADLQALPNDGMVEFAESLVGMTIPATVRGSGSPTEDAIEAGTAELREKPKLPRILILPPSDIASGQGENNIVHAFVEDITINLCRTRSLAVVAAHTAYRLATEANERPEELKRHNISYVLETRLRTDNSQALLFATLSDCSTDSMIWAERFSLAAPQLAASYLQITRKIAETVVNRVERHELTRARTANNPDAYQHYLIGQNHLRKIDLPNIRRARKSFRSALTGSSDYASALSGMARTQHLEWLLLARGETPLLQDAESNAMKAILADPENAAGYRELGVAKLFLGQFDESIDVFEAAEQTAPTHADLIADYADTLIHASQPKIGLEKIARAIELNPLCPDVYWWTAAGANYCLEQFETALTCIEKMEDQSATTRLAAACWGMLGNTNKSQKLVKKTMETYPDFEIENWLSVFSVKEDWQREQYREGLVRAGFK